MPERTWTATEDPPADLAQWQPDGPALRVGDTEDLEDALVDAIAVLRRVGGMVIIAADRYEIAPEMFVTTGFRFKWASYAPAQRLAADHSGNGTPPPDEGELRDADEEAVAAELDAEDEPQE